MNLGLYIAKRYLFSKKSHNAINVISLISVCGIAVATTALICALSVFNGFTSVAERTFNSFDPELQITPLEGKVFSPKDIDLEELRKIESIDIIAESLEENALLKYSDRQKPILFKGVSEEFSSLADIEKLLIDGQFQLRTGDIDHGVLGATLAYELGVRPGFLSPLEIYIPKRDVAINMMNPAASFNQHNIFLAGVFSLNQAKYDEQMFIISIDLARDLLSYEDEVSSLNIKLKEGSSISSAKKEIQKIAGNSFAVKDRFEQQADIYKMMNMEKWVTFLILAIILTIAIFNIVGSLSMLIIEKKKDISILRSMGADNKLIEKIFFYEGCLILFSGAIIGSILGLTISLIQQHFGVIKLGSSPELFIMDAYPVTVQTLDVVLIFATVNIVGLLAILYPIQNLRKSLGL